MVGQLGIFFLQECLMEFWVERLSHCDFNVLYSRPFQRLEELILDELEAIKKFSQALRVSPSFACGATACRLYGPGEGVHGGDKGLDQVLGGVASHRL